MHTASQLRKINNESKALFRIGGDEFVIVLGGLSSRAQVVRIVQEALELLGCLLYFSSHDHLVAEISIDISLSDDDTNNPQKLLNMADAAMYEAKKQEGTNH